MSVYLNPFVQHLDENANPLEFGRILFYEAGTTTLKTIYTDATLGTPAANPSYLDIGGFVRDGGIWLGTGTYKVVLQSWNGGPTGIDTSYDTFKEIDDYTTAGATAASFSVGAVATMADLRALASGAFSVVYMAGYFAKGDMGNGWFYWDSTAVAVDDAGYTIQPNGAPATGRWIRILASLEINPMQWGGRTGSSYNNGVNFENMIEWAKLNTDYTIVLPRGDWYSSSNVLFDGDISVRVEDGFRLRSVSNVLLTFNCLKLDIKTDSAMCVPFPSSETLMVINTLVDDGINPVWFGTTVGTGTNSTIYFNLIATSIGTNFINVKNPYFIDGVNFQGRKVVFTESGVLELGSGSNQFSEIESERSIGADIIRGDYTGLSIDMSEIYGDWFDFDGTVDSASYSTWITALASGGEKVVKWRTGTFTFNVAMSNANVGYLYYDISAGVLFKATGVAVDMPPIISKSHCIDNTGTGTFNFSNSLALSCFGANKASATSTNDALSYAFKCECRVFGDGVEYDINQEVLVDNDAYLSDIILRPTSSYTGDSVFEFNGAHTLELDRVKVINAFVGAGYSVKSAIAGATIILDQCYFSGAASVYTTASTTVYVNDCAFVGAKLDLSSVTGLVSGSRFGASNVFKDCAGLTICNNLFGIAPTLYAITLYNTTGFAGTGRVTVCDNVFTGSDLFFIRGFNESTGLASQLTNWVINVERNTGTTIATRYALKTGDINLSSTGIQNSIVTKPAGYNTFIGFGNEYFGATVHSKASGSAVSDVGIGAIKIFESSTTDITVRVDVTSATGGGLEYVTFIAERGAV